MSLMHAFTKIAKQWVLISLTLSSVMGFMKDPAYMRRLAMIRSNLMLSDLQHLNLLSHTNPVFMMNNIQNLVSSCLKQIFHSLKMCLDCLTACIQKTLKCREIRHLWDGEEMQNEIGCIIIYPPATLNDQNGYYIAVDNVVLFRIRGSPKQLLNATFTRLQLRHMSLICTMYHIIIEYIWTPEGQMILDTCFSNEFPTDVISFVSNSNRMNLWVHGFLTREDHLTIHYCALPQDTKLAALGITIQLYDNIITEVLGNDILRLRSFFQFKLTGIPGSYYIIFVGNDLANLVKVCNGPGPQSPQLPPSNISDTHHQWMTPYHIVVLVAGPSRLPKLAHKFASFFVIDKVKLFGKHFGNSSSTEKCIPKPQPYFSEVSSKVTLSISRSHGNYPTAYCLWYLNGHDKSTVLQLHLDIWQYSGPADISCSYGGLQIFSYDNEDLVEDVRLCGKTLHGALPAFNVVLYSSLSIAAILVTFFNPYSTGTAHGHISVSKCVVYARPCIGSKTLFHMELSKNDALKSNNYECAILQYALTHEEFKQENCRLRIRANSFDMVADVWNAHVYYGLPDPIFNYYIHTTTKYADSWKKISCSLSHLFYINLKIMHLLKDIHEIKPRLLLTFRQVQVLMVELCLETGHQLPLVLKLTNMTVYYGFVPAGGINFYRVLITQDMLPLHVSPYIVSAADTKQLETKFKFIFRLPPSDAFQIQFSVITFLFGICPTSCSNNSISLLSKWTAENRQQVFTSDILGVPSHMIYPFILTPYGSLSVECRIFVSRQVSKCEVASRNCALAFTIKLEKIRSSAQCSSTPLPQTLTSLPTPPTSSITSPSLHQSFQRGFYASPGNSSSFYVPLQKQIQKLSWIEAKQNCARMGASLATLDTTAVHSPQGLFQHVQHALWCDLWDDKELAHMLDSPIFIGMVLTVDGMKWENAGPVVINKGLGGKDYRKKLSEYNDMLRSAKAMPTQKMCGMISSLRYNQPYSYSIVPCDKLYNAIYLCQFPKRDRTVSSKKKHLFSPNSPLLVDCGKGWMILKKMCVAPLRPAEYETGSYCKSVGLQTYQPQVDDKAHIFFYIYTQMLLGSICIAPTISPDDHAAFEKMLSEFNLDPLYLNYQKETGIEYQIRHAQICAYFWVFCQKDLPHTKLDISHFSHIHRCLSEEFIVIDSLCDGTIDCSSGEDEANCSLNCVALEPDSQLDCRLCDADKCQCHDTYFQCYGGDCVHYSAVCDNIPDCFDASDETLCPSESLCLVSEFACDEGLCLPLNVLCDGKTDCGNGQDEANCTGQSCLGYHCSNDVCIQQSKVNNLVYDCVSGEDETEYNLVHTFFLYFMKISNCTIGHLPCFPGHSKCFPFHKACVYDLEADKTISFCANGRHLKYCQYMECPSGTYKCPDSYCIPVRMVCDDTNDCPGHEDEEECPLRKCPPGFLKCKGEIRCLAPEEICDGLIQCHLYKDDEDLCFLPECPDTCQCMLHSIQCEAWHKDYSMLFNVSSDMFYAWRRNLAVLSIQKSNLTEVTSFVTNSSNLKYLNVAFNNISLRNETHQVNIPSLIYLDVSHNLISTLTDWFFGRLTNVKYLNAANNVISVLTFKTFTFHSKINILNFSNNFIHTLNFDYLDKHLTITHLHLLNNPIATTQGFYVDLEIHFHILITDTFGLCCKLKPVVAQCNENEDICLPLLQQRKHRLIYLGCWVILSFLCTVAGMLSYLRTKRNRKSSTRFSQYKFLETTPFLQQNTILADSIQTMYLLSTIFADQYFNKTFPWRRRQWFSGSICYLLRISNLLGTFQSFYLCVLNIIYIHRTLLATAFYVTDIKINTFTIIGWPVVGLGTAMLFNNLQTSEQSHSGACNGFPKPINNCDLVSIDVLPHVMFISLAVMSTLLHSIFLCRIVRKINDVKKASKRVGYSHSEKSFFFYLAVTTACRWLYMTLVIPLSYYPNSYIDAYTSYDVSVTVYAALSTLCIIIKLLSVYSK